MFLRLKLSRLNSVNLILKLPTDLFVSISHVCVDSCVIVCLLLLLRSTAAGILGFWAKDLLKLLLFLPVFVLCAARPLLWYEVFAHIYELRRLMSLCWLLCTFLSKKLFKLILKK